MARPFLAAYSNSALKKKSPVASTKAPSQWRSARERATTGSVDQAMACLASKAFPIAWPSGSHWEAGASSSFCMTVSATTATKSLRLAASVGRTRWV